MRKFIVHSICQVQYLGDYPLYKLAPTTITFPLSSSILGALEPLPASLLHPAKPRLDLENRLKPTFSPFLAKCAYKNAQLPILNKIAECSLFFCVDWAYFHVAATKTVHCTPAQSWTSSHQFHSSLFTLLGNGSTHSAPLISSRFLNSSAFK